MVFDVLVDSKSLVLTSSISGFVDIAQFFVGIYTSMVCVHASGEFLPVYACIHICNWVSLLETHISLSVRNQQRNAEDR